MFSGKMKAVTFSFDDGITQDIRLARLFDKYGLKATFNMNSQLMGTKAQIIRKGVRVRLDRLDPEDIRLIGARHEIAVHTLTHPYLQNIEDDEEIIRQIEEDRKYLEHITGGSVVGMAYPGNGENTDRVARIISDHTSIRYARTTFDTHSFELQDNLLQFNPTVQSDDFDTMFKLGREFVKLKPESPKLFYIWGHGFEPDASDMWDRLEEFFEFISGRDDIFYGTNREVLL